MPKKYTALRVIATIYRILGWLIVVLGVIGSITLGVLLGIGIVEYEEELDFGLGLWGIIPMVIGGVIFSLLSGLGLLAFADLFYVGMDIEKNTRQIKSGE